MKRASGRSCIVIVIPQEVSLRITLLTCLPLLGCTNDMDLA